MSVTLPLLHRPSSPDIEGGKQPSDLLCLSDFMYDLMEGSGGWCWRGERGHHQQQRHQRNLSRGSWDKKTPSSTSCPPLLAGEILKPEIALSSLYSFFLLLLPHHWQCSVRWQLLDIISLFGAVVASSSSSYDAATTTTAAAVAMMIFYYKGTEENEEGDSGKPVGWGRWYPKWITRLGLPTCLQFNKSLSGSFYSRVAFDYSV